MYENLFRRSNFLYTLRSDIDLNGESINVAKCVINFDGGSLSNGSITCDRTEITGNVKMTNITINGTLSNYGNEAISQNDIFGRYNVDISTFNVHWLCKDKVWRDAFGYKKAKKNGSTSERPALVSSDMGFQYYDTTLKKYICWSGTAWTNLDGTALT